MSQKSKINNNQLVFEIEELIKKYNKKPEKKVKKRDIINLLQDAVLIVPASANFSQSEVNLEEINNLLVKPDIVKNSRGQRLLPAFTSYSQIPADYMESFSLIKVKATIAYSYMNECDGVNGIVLNPFTEANLELPKKKNIEKKVAETRGISTAVVDDEKDGLLIHDNKKYTIHKTPFTIGRTNANIVIEESYISKIHVVISYKDGKYRIADYDSTNGTTVNGTALRPKVYYELRDGYIIELSDKEKFVFYCN